MRRLYSEPITHEGQLDNLLFATNKNPPRENDLRRARALARLTSYVYVHDNIHTYVQMHFHIRNMCKYATHHAGRAKRMEWDPAVAPARRLRLDNTESKRATVALIPCSGSTHGPMPR